MKKEIFFSLKNPLLRVFLEVLFFLGFSTTAVGSITSACKGEESLHSNMDSLLSLLQKEQTYQNRRGLALTHISRAFFDTDKVTPVLYENRVRCLYTFFKRDPGTVSELLFLLQKEWEARYLLERYLEDRQRDQGFQLAILGGASLGTSMVLLRNASFAATYFKFFRKMFPAQGAIIGGAVYGIYNLGKPLYKGTQKKQKEQKEQKGSPPQSPAHLLELPSLNREEAEYTRELEKQWTGTLSMVLGMEVGSISYYVMRGSRVVQATNKALTPFKLNPLVFLASIGVGVGVDAFCKWFVDEVRERVLEEDYSLARQGLLQAHQNKEGLDRQIPLAEAFVEATYALSVFYQWKFLEHYREYKDHKNYKEHKEYKEHEEHEEYKEHEEHEDYTLNWNKNHKEALIRSTEFLQEAEGVLRFVAGQSYLLLYSNILGSDVNRQKLLLEYLNTLPSEEGIIEEGRAGIISQTGKNP